MNRLVVILLFILTVTCFSFAQETETDSTSLKDVVKTFLGLDQPKIGFIGQVAGEISDNGKNTTSAFTIRNIRLYLSGTAGEHFAYVFQGDMNGSYFLLDLKFSYIFDEHFRIDGGKFKTPFGMEYPRNDAKLLFVKHSTAASTIGTFRKYGAQVQSSWLDKRVVLTAGAFNGDYSVPKKVSLFVGKAHTIPIKSGEVLTDFQLETGGSIAYTENEDDLTSYTYFKNNHILSAINLKMKYDSYWIEGEYFAATSNRNRTQDGFYIDAVGQIGTDWEIAGRFDWSAKYHKMVYQNNILQWILSTEISRKYLVGINYYPLSHVKLQLDYERDQTLKINSGWLNCQYAVNFE